MFIQLLNTSSAIIFGLAIAFLAISKVHVAWEISKLRAQGIYPQKGQATIDDVVRLKELGLNPDFPSGDFQST